MSTDLEALEIAAALSEAVTVERVQRDCSLAQYTTFKVGGTADFFADVGSEKELLAVLQVARQRKLPVTMLGGGSNVLIGDGGIRGLVVRFRHGEVRRPGPDIVRASAGVTLNGLVRWMVRRGISGIEAWAGTPGTVGGAVAGNAHFEGRLLSETIHRVGLVGKELREELVPVSDMNFGYGISRIPTTKEVILWAEFKTGDASHTDLLESSRKSLRYRKSTQPLSEPSAGCVFKNPKIADDEKALGVACSAGALIDRAGLKGCAEGAVRVSERHANFFVTRPNATATDIKVLMARCQQTVKQRFDVELVPEIVLLGEFEE
tara:strand:+ start:22476 stop:23435 length:960 start_codon:yes stop_codon:yes gene_type:complete